MTNTFTFTLAVAWSPSRRGAIGNSQAWIKRGAAGMERGGCLRESHEGGCQKDKVMDQVMVDENRICQGQEQ